MSLYDITTQINNLLPDSCYLVTGNLNEYQNELSPIELKYIAEYSDFRKKEFTAGRSVAKEAAKSLGFKLLSIQKDTNGCPLWPEPIVGSISHKGGICGALIGKRDRFSSIGLDIELEEPLEEAVWKTFTSNDELEQANKCNIKKLVLANMLFSAKEAYFKCLYPQYSSSSVSISDIFVAIQPSGKNRFRTKVMYMEQELYGGVVTDGKILISWAFLTEK